LSTTDLASSAPWLESLRRSRARRFAAVRALRRRRGFRAGAGVALASLTLATGGALAAGTSSGGAAAVRSAGSSVAAVQRALGIPADGVFGPQTRRAVKHFQRAHGLTVDGIVGPQTLGALGVSAAAASDASTRTVAATTTTTPAGAGVQAAVSAALSKVGSPYSSGATGPSSFDCSGLTSWAMRQAGIAIPRTSFAQFGTGSSVGKGAIQSGDLVFFDTAGPGASDVGIATGPTTVVSATTHGVMNHAIFDSYWGSHFVGARRVG